MSPRKKSSDPSRSGNGHQSDNTRGNGNRPASLRNDQQTTGALPPGTAAPAFELTSTPDQRVDLAQFRGRPVILAFYPADWSPVCGDQLSLYNEILPEFNQHAAQLLAISVDQSWCHVAYAKIASCTFRCLPISSLKAPWHANTGCTEGTTESVNALYSSSTAMESSAGHMCLLWVSIREPMEFSGRWKTSTTNKRNPNMRAATNRAEAHLSAPVSDRRDHIRGNPSAGLTLVEYGDYQCPYCGAAHPIVNELLDNLGDEIRFVFRHFPL